MGINKVALIGNVGRTPEGRDIGENNHVVNFSLATSDRRFKDKDTGKPKTEWHNIVAFGKLSEIIEKYVDKGDSLYLEGRIQTRSWEKDGQKQWMTEVVADQMEMLSSKSDKAAKPEPGDDVPFGGYTTDEVGF